MENYISGFEKFCQDHRCREGTEDKEDFCPFKQHCILIKSNIKSTWEDAEQIFKEWVNNNGNLEVSHE